MKVFAEIDADKYRKIKKNADKIGLTVPEYIAVLIESDSEHTVLLQFGETDRLYNKILDKSKRSNQLPAEYIRNILWRNYFDFIRDDEDLPEPNSAPKTGHPCRKYFEYID